MKEEEARNYLQCAYAALQAGQPMLALDVVCSLIHETAGPQAVFPILDQARARWRNSAAQSPSADDIGQLAALLLSNCVITPQEPQLQPQRSTVCSIDPEVLEGLASGSILAEERGRGGEFLGGALRDGASYVCPRCQGVVSSRRRAAHENAWCPGFACATSTSTALGEDGRNGEGGEGEGRRPRGEEEELRAILAAEEALGRVRLVLEMRERGEGEDPEEMG